jgi:endonuclease/exonuclease/phosphatase (EEP) superfamily protein YafD
LGEITLEILAYILRILNGLFIISLILPHVNNDHWTFRVFEFPRLQKLVIAIILIIGTAFILLNKFNYWDAAFILANLIGAAYLIGQIFPFLPIASKQVMDVNEKHMQADLSLLVNNVYQYNEDFDKLIALVIENKPDMVMLVETDKKWKDKCVEGFGDAYPHQVLEDLDNTYGMLLFSKLKLENTNVRYIIKEGIPSIKTDVVFKDGRRIRFYGLHPEPPVPSENPKSTARDAEILKVAKEVCEDELPCLIAGDLNDVAWSFTKELFLKTSGALDPRRGRGFFNTFHASYSLLRWPLDHIFCTKEFCVNFIDRLSYTGSDHFPMFVGLSIENGRNNDQELEQTEEDEKLTDEKIEKAE